MRVIAGTLGGRTFASPRSHRTHPMSDRVRGALFNTLGDIHGLTVLDAFAGSGALGFEAISRGASRALLVENDKPAQAAIIDNIRQLNIRNAVRLVKANCSSWSDTSLDQQFDVVLLDPPYDDIHLVVLEKLTRHSAPGGIVVLSWPGKQPPPTWRSLETVDAKQYGDAQLLFYRSIDHGGLV